MTQRGRRSERWLSIDDYRTGSLPEDEVAAFEEELFDDAARGETEDLLFLQHFADDLAFLGRHTLPGVSSTATRLAELHAAGVRVHVIDVDFQSETVIHAWPEDVELVVSCLHVDARGHSSVDVLVELPDGSPVTRFHDIGCDPASGKIYVPCEEPLARMALRSSPLRVRVLARTGEHERELAVGTARPG